MSRQAVKMPTHVASTIRDEPTEYELSGTRSNDWQSQRTYYVTCRDYHIGVGDFGVFVVEAVGDGVVLFEGVGVGF